MGGGGGRGLLMIIHCVMVVWSVKSGSRSPVCCCEHLSFWSTIMPSIGGKADRKLSWSMSSPAAVFGSPRIRFVFRCGCVPRVPYTLQGSNRNMLLKALFRPGSCGSRLVSLIAR